MSVAVVTDSGACLPPSLARAHGIGVVELHTTDTEGAWAATSRPSVAELAGAYRRAAQRAEEVLALHLTAALSGTIDNARQAAAEVNGSGAGPVTVVDSGTSGGALALAAMAASRAPDARRAAALARESASRSRLFFLVDDLTHLRRGGRIDRTTALLGGALGVRPILEVTSGGIVVAETVRGAARARRHLIDRAVRAAGGAALSGPRPPMEPVRLALHYCDDPAAGRALEEDLAAAMVEAGAQVSSIMRSPVDAATRVHVGPGALAVVVAPTLEAHP